MIGLEVKEKVKDILLEKFIQIRASVIVQDGYGTTDKQKDMMKKYAELDVVNMAFSEVRKHIEISTEKDDPFPAAKHVHFYIMDVGSAQKLISLIKDIFRNDRG